MPLIRYIPVGGDLIDACIYVVHINVRTYIVFVCTWFFNSLSGTVNCVVIVVFTLVSLYNSNQLLISKKMSSFSGGVSVQYSEQPTNNITYFRALSGISLLPDDLKVYVPLFCNAITQ